MDKNKFWRKNYIFDNQIEIHIPYCYEKKEEKDNQYFFIKEKCKGIFLTYIETETEDVKGEIYNIYHKLKNKESNISQLEVMKRTWRGIEQYMLKFSNDEKNNYIIVIFYKNNKQFLIEFSYIGEFDECWEKECEYILNTIHFIEGEVKNGN